MDRSERVGKLVFVAAPLVAAAVGYRYMGWLGALVYALAALPVLAIAVMTCFLVVLGFGFVRDRKRVGLLPTDSLREVIANPEDPDFRFAFAELRSRREDVQSTHRLLLTMLRSNDDGERRTSFARLQELHPKLRKVLSPSIEDEPGHLHAWVIDTLGEQA